MTSAHEQHTAVGEGQAMSTFILDEWYAKFIERWIGVWSILK